MSSTPKNDEILLKGNHLFSCELFKHVTQKTPEGNVFFSPYSLSTVLSMVLAGARENTKKQLLEGLGLQGLDSEPHPLFRDSLASLADSGTTTVANAVFIQEGFTPLSTFVELLVEMYHATATNVDFSKDSAMDQINNWVNNATKEKIPKVVDNLDEDTVMILLNAVHFKSFWEKQFNPTHTEAAQFFLNKNDSVSVKMMYQSGKFRFGCNSTADCEILELPYQDGRTSMLIFLPKELDGLRKIEESLNPSFLQKALQDLRRPCDMFVWLPAFKLEESYTLSPILSSMGMSDLFEPGRANLRGISEKDDLYVSEVIHKSFIEVNEEGTEAAAVSAAMVMNRCAPRNKPFRADHPFIFCILEKSSQHVLFLGSLKKPTAA